MRADRLKQIALTSLVAILALVLYWTWQSTSVSPTSNGQVGGAAGTAQRSAAGAIPAAPDVHLEHLKGEWPKPANTERNLFQFKRKPPPAPAGQAASRSTTIVPSPTAPPGPPPLAPIALKFIGIIERPEKAQRIAMLRDAVGHVFSGAEGAVVEGRFRILKIGVESIEMAYVDGRGRQTIRLSGG